MKLYSDLRSGSCRRVLALIGHLDLDVEIVETDILAGETHSEAFTQMNPNGMVPVLVDSDVVLWEASAIMLYLCDKAGDNVIAPSGNARFDMLRWMFWAAEHFRVSAPIYFEEAFIAPIQGGAPDTHRLAEADRRIEKFAPLLDTHLATHCFVLGETATLADIDLAAPLSQMARSGVPYAPFKNIMRWYEDLGEAMPAWKETGEQLDDAMNRLLNAAQ